MCWVLHVNPTNISSCYHLHNTCQEEVYGRRTRVLASGEATSPIWNLENVVNLPILVSLHCRHFMSSPFDVAVSAATCTISCHQGKITTRTPHCWWSGNPSSIPYNLYGSRGAMFASSNFRIVHNLCIGLYCPTSFGRVGMTILQSANGEKWQSISNTDVVCATPCSATPHHKGILSQPIPKPKIQYLARLIMNVPSQMSQQL